MIWKKCCAAIRCFVTAAFVSVIGLSVIGLSVIGLSAAHAQKPPAAQKPASESKPTIEPKAAAEVPGEEFKLNGFRSATFGMTADQVRQAIRKDFNISGDKIEAVENGAEKTQILATTVPDLLPGSGAAQVAYVFGFRTRQLVQVSVTWGAVANAPLTPATAVDIGRMLQSHLTSVGYKADTVVINAAQPDGSIIMFRGDDAQKRRAILILTGVAAPEGQRPAGPPLLQLSYIRDIAAPDVFQIRKGDF